MKKRSNRAFVIVACFFYGQLVVADDLTIPNTFQTGQPARAAEVNANFDAVETSVDDNAAGVAANSTAIGNNAAGIAANTSGVAANTASIGTIATVQWLANGQPIGSVVGLTGLLTFSNYLVLIERSENRVEKFGSFFYFVSPGCVGQKYSTAGLTNSEQGKVFQAPNEIDPIRLYYWPQGSIPIEDIVFQSRTDSANGCIDETNSPVDGALPVLPNDPAVTGIATEYFDLPLTMGHR